MYLICFLKETVNLDVRSEQATDCWHTHRYSIRRGGSPGDSTEPEACPSAEGTDLSFFLLAPDLGCCKSLCETPIYAGPSATILAFCWIDAHFFPCLPAPAGVCFLAACSRALLTSYSSCLFLTCVSDDAPDQKRVTALVCTQAQYCSSAC